MLQRSGSRRIVPMIKELGLRNFKAFGNENQSAPMSRISLLYGPNSGGKSSVIQALLLLKQSEGNLPRAGVLAPQGEYVDLAGFKAMVHRHDEEREFEVNINLDIASGSEATIDLTFGKDEQHLTALPVLNGVGYGTKGGNRVNDLTVRLQLNKGQSARTEETANFGWADPESSIASYGQYLHRLLTDESVRPRYFTLRMVRARYPNLISALQEQGGLTEEMMSILRRATVQARSSVLPAALELEESTELSESSELSEFKEYLSFSRAGMGTFSHSFGSFLEGMSYLGPILDDPRRFYLSWGGRRSTVGKRGEYTFDIISHEDKVRTDVNSWFDRFDIPYQIKNVHNVADSELTGSLSTMALEDTRTGTVVTSVDVGFGISQILPVIVEGVAGTSRVVCVDQPEVHLHPKLQADIADFLIECKDKQWIVETHSELLVRRILRRVAERKIEPSDVSVLYVDPPKPSESGSGSTINVLEVEDGGTFSSSTPWPQGFFEDGYAEMMATIRAGGVSR